MTEEGSSNLNLNQIMLDLSKNLIDVQQNCNNLQLKNQSLENEIKSLDLKTKNEISGLKQIIDQKDEKINSLEKQITKKSFVHIKNKWKEIERKCCKNKCVNTNKPIGNCIKGNGFVNLIDDENIKYINCVEGKGEDILAIVYSENKFNKPEESFNYSLYYFEVKCKIEGKKNSKPLISICLEDNDYFEFTINDASISQQTQNEEKLFKLLNFTWNNEDIFGCGLVYPPTKINELPYIFFTQNGKQIGKAIILKGNSYIYQPQINLKCCSVDTNFGNDLDTKPFCCDITKHFVLKQFYENSEAEKSDSDESELDEDKLKKEEKDINELAEMFPLINKEVIEHILLSKGRNKEETANTLVDFFPKID
uniref:CUE domain-containing protein n=1 Tax=Meloidogyne hapla TaxID=6305 RepID=A0A1I8BDX5_MELHA